MNGYLLELDAAGNLVVSLDGVVVLKTKGNPLKGNIPFVSLEEATAYFSLLPMAQVIEELPVDPVDPPADPAA